MPPRGHLRRSRRADDDSQATQTFEEELRDRVDLSPAPEASLAPSATDAVPEPADTDFDAVFEDNFEGIVWERLLRFMKPLRTQKHKKS